VAAEHILVFDRSGSMLASTPSNIDQLSLFWCTGFPDTHSGFPCFCFGISQQQEREVAYSLEVFA
jgi:hypothetical protein